MFIIVGLGNPGSDYESTRHNLGFMLIDRLASDAGVAVGRRECSSLVGRGEIEGSVVKLVKPQTFMNLSGQAVSCLIAKEPEQRMDRLLVISDDLALPLGKIRIRERGTAGGHNGLKSIIGSLGTSEFMRLRIGIQPEHPISDPRRFVLDSFAKSERATVDEVLALSAKAVRTIISEGVLKAMSEFN
ncbi:MAG TPA: aminoacyl-tRNA hydrolase [Pyrinomonadaceae bacterium]|jgi:PTH1 family peptidyl-tRNA hydrolase|nr:aminoacyl-tRNA hydrolase [Pyrinomonadaceae bacterium]